MMALGMIGDPRATPLLMKYLMRELEKGWNPIYGYPKVLDAIANLKPVEAVDPLIQHIDKPSVPETLGRIGDPRAIPALRPLAEAGNMEAMVALCRLGDDEIISSLVTQATNLDRDDLDRVGALHALNEALASPRIVPLLVRVVHNDPSGMVCDIAIRSLAQHKTNKAIHGLIGCFEIDFAEKAMWKPAYLPEHYRAHIAQSLEQLTGQTFGDNPDAWRKWWMTTGERQFAE